MQLKGYDKMYIYISEIAFMIVIWFADIQQLIGDLVKIGYLHGN